MSPNTPLRYPGGKGKLTDFIRAIFEQNALLDGHYVEPYAGGAAIALNLLILDYASCVHLNDLDRSVFAFWHSVLNRTDELCRKVHDIRLTMDEWKKQRKIQRAQEQHDLLELGFSTLFLNRTNRSGILTGGAIGGIQQTGQWKIDARFNRQELCRRIEKIAFHRSRIRLYNLDAADLVTDVLPTLPKKTLVYLDPPYYAKADRLYKNIYKPGDHAHVSKMVMKKIKMPWIVSYDHAPQVVQLYRGCRHIIYSMTYSAAERYKGSEVMFFSKGLAIPDTKSPLEVRAA